MRRVAYFRLAILCAIGFFFTQQSVEAQVVQIGSGTTVSGSSTPSPVNIWFRSSHHQIIYRKDELNAAGIFGGRITKLGFDVVQKPLYNLPNYTVKIGHTTMAEPSTNVVAAFQTVYTNAIYIPDTTGFDMLTFSEPFFWNGNDNIVLDICWGLVTPTFNSSGTVRTYQDSLIDYGRFTWSDNTVQCANPPSSQTIKPQVKFEFVPLQANDAAVLSTNLGATVCTGSAQVKATVGNYGTNVLSSVMIGWTVNGVAQTPVLNSTTIDTLNGLGSSQLEITLGNYTFAMGNLYTIKIFTYLPNSSSDPYNPNDTLTFVVSGGLNGTYTIGGITPDYATIGAALTAIATHGICDTVILSIRSGTYNEQLTIGQITAASSSDYVIFQSESGDSTSVVISFVANSTNNFTLNLNNASNLLFRNLTLKSLGTTYGRVINLMGTSLSNIRFENCAFEGISVTSTSSNYYIINSTSSATFSGLVFRDCRFTNGSAALWLSMNWNNGNGSSGFEISDCIGTNQYRGFLVGTSLKAPIVTGNTISTNLLYSVWDGIELNEPIQTMTVTGNRISGARGGYGIYTSYGNFTSVNTGLIANNFVSGGNSADQFVGIYLYDMDYTNVYYNSVNIHNSTNVNNRALDIEYGNFVDSRNNILNSSEGYAYYVLPPSNFTSDNNCIYSSGSKFAFYNTEVSDLSAWLGASNRDSSSISVNPYFTSFNSFQTAQVALNGAATPIASVTTDIQGETRNATTPDIGADEFTPTGTDAAILSIITPTVPFAPGSYVVSAVLQNQGANALTSATINWLKDGIAQTPVSWTGSLVSGELDTLNLGSVSFLNQTLSSFEVFSSNPNGSPDTQPINDTVWENNIAPGLGGTYTLGGVTPSFLTFSDLSTWLSAGGVYAAVTVNVRSGTYNENVTFGYIPGADSTKTITVQSEIGDSNAADYSEKWKR